MTVADHPRIDVLTISAAAGGDDAVPTLSFWRAGGWTARREEVVQRQRALLSASIFRAVGVQAGLPRLRRVDAIEPNARSPYLDRVPIDHSRATDNVVSARSRVCSKKKASRNHDHRKHQSREHSRFEALTEPLRQRNFPSRVHAFTPPFLPEHGVFLASAMGTARNASAIAVASICLAFILPPPISVQDRNELPRQVELLVQSIPIKSCAGSDKEGLVYWRIALAIA